MFCIGSFLNKKIICIVSFGKSYSMGGRAVFKEQNVIAEDPEIAGAEKVSESYTGATWWTVLPPRYFVSAIFCTRQ